ncbi:retrovirus-related pol polyprotein from transposon TNT 1-94 [Tanacetum coccineum]
MQMIRENQFNGKFRSNPYRHIVNFLEISNLFQYGENQEEAVKLRIFPFSLSGEAKIWLNELNEETITTWGELREAFWSVDYLIDVNMYGRDDMSIHFTVSFTELRDRTLVLQELVIVTTGEGIFRFLVHTRLIALSESLSLEVGIQFPRSIATRRSKQKDVERENEKRERWKSRIKRYIDTKPNSELIHYCLQNPPYTYQWAEKTVPVAEGSSETTTERYTSMQSSGFSVTTAKEYGQVVKGMSETKTSKGCSLSQGRRCYWLNYDHYMYMAQIQEVTPAVDNSGPIFDDEPMHKVQNNNDNYNVFAMENEHPEQPESSNDIYLAEQGDTNITIDSSDICYDRAQDDQDETDDLDQERDLLASLIQKLKCEIDDSKNRNKFLESSNKELVDKLKGEIEDFKTKNKSLESSNNHFKEANNELSKTNQLMFKDLKKFQAELDKYNDVNYASKVEIDCAKAKGDLMSYKIDFEKSSNAYTQKINDLNQTISDMKKELCAHQETISIMSQAKEAQIKLYKTREDKELDKVIALENKVKVLNDIVYKTGQSVQTMNMLNRNCKTSFAKPEFLKKAQRANPRLYDIGCYNDNLALMLAPDSDETIRLEKERRSKLSDLIRPFDYDQLNNLYDLFVPQREKSAEQHYFPKTSKMSHTSSNKEFSKESFRKQTTLLEKRMDESIPWDQKCKSSKELFKIKKSVDTIFDGVERCKQTIAKRTYFGNIDPFIQNTIEGNFGPQISRLNADLENFHLCLNEEMVADLRYFNSLEHEVDTLKSQLETQKTQFLNEIDRLSREYYYADHMNAILGVYTDLDEFTNLQCDYVETWEKCEHLEKELSKSRTMSKSFEALQKHAINLELDLQQCKEKIKNDKSFKENQSNVFLKEREQYFEIQDLKAQLQEKGIAISELKKLIEKMKGKSVETKFEKSSVIRQPNAFKSQRQSILGKPAIFSDSLAKKDFSKSKPVTTQNVSNDFSKPVTAQILPQNMLPIVKNTNVIAPGIVSRPQLKCNQLEDRVMPNNSQWKKQNVEDHRMHFKFSNNKTSVTACNDSLNAKTSNVNFVCVTCRKCMDISKITRNESKTGKHEHENGRVHKSQKQSQEKVNPQSNNELPQMASDHVSSDPGPQCSTTVLEQDSLSPGPQSQENVPQVAETVTTSNELELLYSLMFSELLNGNSPVVSKSSAVHAADNPDKQTNTENAQFDDDEFINIFSTPVQEQGETSSRHVDTSNMHTFYQHHPSAQRWTKDHPLEQVIGNPSESVRTRRQLETDGEMNELSSVERLDVWELVDRPLCKNVINLKWLWKNKRDEENTIIRNKSRLVAKGYAQKEGIDFRKKSHLHPVQSVGEAVLLFIAYAAQNHYIVPN